MSKDLEHLLQEAQARAISETEQELQRLSFAYGNAHFENEMITKDTVARAAEDLRAQDEKNRRSTR